MPSTRRQVLATAKALAIGSLAGCTAWAAPGTAPAESNSATPPESITPEHVSQLVRGNTGFAFDLLDTLTKQTPNSNLFCSPYSISIALAMTTAGARGQTREQMVDTLQYPTLGEQLHPAFARVRQQVTGEEQTETATPDSDSEAVPFQLAGANTLWGQKNYPWSQAYLDTLEANYGAGLHEVDFANHAPRARRRINDWVASQTEGKITELIPKGTLGSLTRLVLTNALYFRANWASTFDEDATESRQFTAIDGQSESVPTMEQTDEFRYAAVNGHQLVELPYAGGDASMIVLLPAPGQFESFERSLTPERLNSLLGNLSETTLKLRLPKFAYRTGLSLKQTLAAMGMSIPFDPTKADFGGMVSRDDSDLHIGDVLHKSYVSVDEQGTEAAAATAVEMETTSLVRGEQTMTVDRPFLFLIREQETGSVIFLGRVVDAAAAQPE